MIINDIMEKNGILSSNHDSHIDWFVQGCLKPQASASCIAISRSPFTIGRRNTNDCTLGSQKVSGQHAQLLVVGDKIFVRDLNSTNGTYVNGNRIMVDTPLAAGDYLQFADMEFQLGRNQEQRIDQTIEFDEPETGWQISKMNQVVQEQQFRMVFQPIVTAAGESLYGVEALLRCHIAGFESPIMMFEIASRLGLEERLSEAARFKAAMAIAPHHPAKRLFLNTHPNEHLGEKLIGSLSHLRSLIGDWKIVIEIHEAAVPNLATIREFQAQLRYLDIEIAYDDFGAGQSRLRELTEVPPNIVKFDRSIVDGLATASTQHRTMVQSLVNVCHESNIITLAEGIDNGDDSEVCREMGFQLFQGFYFGRPAPLEMTPDSTIQ
ncbi:EAL domain-containing protein [uncultured Rubinisphaera sp.]|uniref:EAL domain-containing protein n=1 Tax=uncultured Rubinisphaera sp. TaxID=1678686 RepID=UPI0030DC300A|tara:strand:+ start:621 stop:1757 length:1137 start_codon:yes stop_codon:yes gene_type:complete